jgi:hypothetical protein
MLKHAMDAMLCYFALLLQRAKAEALDAFEEVATQLPLADNTLAAAAKDLKSEIDNWARSVLDSVRVHAAAARERQRLRREAAAAVEREKRREEEEQERLRRQLREQQEQRDRLQRQQEEQQARMMEMMRQAQQASCSQRYERNYYGGGCYSNPCSRPCSSRSYCQDDDDDEEDRCSR